VRQCIMRRVSSLSSPGPGPVTAPPRANDHIPNFSATIEEKFSRDSEGTSQVSRDREIWLFQVDRRMKKLYSIDHVDAGWDEQDIDRFISFDMSPREFSKWYGAKYGLVERESWT